jgi:hypothetical protein
MKKYKVTLTDEERKSLQALIAAGKTAALKLTHARILLKANAAPGGPAWTDARIAEALDVDVTTVEREQRSQVDQPQEVHFEQPDFFDCRAVELCDKSFLPL